MVKLVDTLASGASARKGVEVQVLSWAPLTRQSQSVRLISTSPIVQIMAKVVTLVVTPTSSVNFSPRDGTEHWQAPSFLET